jgi:DHA1 family multidrug resistance protein-like MFS transporter
MPLISQIKILKEPVAILLMGIFIVNLGSFLVIPYIAIYITHTLNFSVVFASYFLTINLLCQRSLAVGGGIMTDRIGAKITIIGGLCLRVIAYLLLALSHNELILISSAVFMGLGSALYSPASKTLILKLSPEKNRSLLLSIRSVAMNAGVALGPLIGICVFSYNPEYVFIICVLSYLVSLFAVTYFVPDKREEVRVHSKIYFGNLKFLVSNNIQKLAIVMIVFMAAYMQIELAIPLYIKAIAGNVGVGLFFTLNAILCISLSIPIVNYMCRFSKDFNIFLSVLLIGLSFVICGLGTATLLLIVAAVIFTVSEIIFFPNFDLKLYSNISRDISGFGFGISDLAASIGGALGILFGGHIFNLIQNHYHVGSYYWLGTGLILIIFSLVYIRSNSDSEIEIIKPVLLPNKIQFLKITNN